MSDTGGPATTSEIVFFKGEDGKSRVQVRLDGGTVWLTQRLLADLYQVSVPTISEHLGHIYDDEELDPAATIRKFRMVGAERNSIGGATIRKFRMVRANDNRIWEAVVREFRLAHVESDRHVAEKTRAGEVM